MRNGYEVGLRYYMPKPYLMITKNVDFIQPGTAPAPAKKDKKEDGGKPKPAVASGTAGTGTGNANKTEIKNKYAAHIVYLPDLAGGKRNIMMKPKWGSVSANLALTHGWQLTSVNVTLDSKAAETVAGAGAVAAGLAPMFTPVAAPAVSNLSDVAAALLEQLKKTAAPGATKAALKDATEELRQELQLLQSLLKEMSPGIWLFEMKVVCGQIKFVPVECFKPFAFADNCKITCPCSCCCCT